MGRMGRLKKYMVTQTIKKAEKKLLSQLPKGMSYVRDVCPIECTKCGKPLWYNNLLEKAREHILEKACLSEIEEERKAYEDLKDMCLICIVEHPLVRPHIPAKYRKTLSMGGKVLK